MLVDSYKVVVHLLLIGFAIKDVSTRQLDPPQTGDLKSLMLNSYIATTNYTIPTLDNLNTAEALFEKLLRTRNVSKEDVDSWSALNLRIQNTVDGSQSYAVISEINPTTGRGHGFYAIKLGPLSNPELSRFLQAPHRPSDLYTHEIVFDLLTSNQCKAFGAAAWSTTHRNNVDLCKEPNSYFNSYTKAVAKVVENPTMFQVHGFDKSSQDIDVDVIFSSTKLTMPPEIESIANCTKKAADSWIVLKYPEEVDFLGGTLNTNAQMFYQTNSKGKFVHFETSKELREELRVNSLLKCKIAECFG